MSLKKLHEQVDSKNLPYRHIRPKMTILWFSAPKWDLAGHFQTKIFLTKILDSHKKIWFQHLPRSQGDVPRWSSPTRCLTHGLFSSRFSKSCHFWPKFGPICGQKGHFFGQNSKFHIFTLKAHEWPSIMPKMAVLSQKTWWYWQEVWTWFCHPSLVYRGSQIWARLKKPFFSNWPHFDLGCLRPTFLVHMSWG